MAPNEPSSPQQQQQQDQRGILTDVAVGLGVAAGYDALKAGAAAAGKAIGGKKDK